MTTLILAGGRSARYGVDKAFAAWQGRPFLEHVVKAVRGVSDAMVVLVRPGSDPRAYAVMAPGATLLPDRTQGAGPVEAIKGAMEFVRTPTVLVVPCDAPGLPPGLARRLVAMCEELGRPVVAAPKAGPVWDLFAIPKDVLRDRLAHAKRLEELLGQAELLSTEADGLNVNEPVAGA